MGLFSIRTLGERVQALDLILKDRLIDETVAACNRAAIADGESARFERRAIASARFVLWYLDTPTRTPSADMHIYADNLGCRYNFLGRASVYGLVDY